MPKDPKILCGASMCQGPSPALDALLVLGPVGHTDEMHVGRMRTRREGREREFGPNDLTVWRGAHPIYIVASLVVHRAWTAAKLLTVTGHAAMKVLRLPIRAKAQNAYESIMCQSRRDEAA